MVGNSRCPIVDTWWQTETGGISSRRCRREQLNPGSAPPAFFGVETDGDAEGKVLDGPAAGKLCIANLARPHAHDLG